jgi:predicted ABC-type sugar transport system permease subunit
MKDISHQVQDIAYQTEKKLLDNLFAAIVLLVGLIMLIIAIVFFINDFFGLNRYWGFFIVGLIMIISALLYKKKIDSTKYYNFER